VEIRACNKTDACPSECPFLRTTTNCRN